jgi:hypothetical protein
MTDATALLREAIQRIQGRDPRFRYYEDARGTMYLWTTERMGDGRFGSAVLVPFGPGSRSGRGKVTRWKTTREVHHSTRKAAKARALRLYLAAKAST